MKKQLQNLTTTFFKVTIALTFLLISSSVFATVRLVDNINDSGNGSLRQAATDAASGDTIRFDPSLLTAAVDSISLSTEIDFGNKSIVIIGLYNSTDTLYISGGNTSRIFSFDGAGKVALDSLVLINGNALGTFTSGNGGAVLCTQSTDTLLINNCTFKNNNANNSGGGISFYSSQENSIVMVVNSTFSENSANSYGGGIYVSVFRNGTSAAAAAVINSTIINSTFSYNEAANSGGGLFIYSENDSSFVTITNSTISHNNANTRGGGVYVYAARLTIFDVTNTTIVNNDAPTDGGVLVGSNNYHVNTSFTIGNSIIAENGTGASGLTFFNNNISAISSVGYNIFSDNPNGAIGTGDQINISAAQLNLGLLQNNGGTTQTMLPGTGSVAIDAGSPSDMSDAQNRAVSGGRRDVGAAEFESCVATASTFSVTAIACEGYTLPSGDSTYSVIGTHTANDVINNAAGCDSVMTISITINDIMNQSITSATSSFCNSGATAIDLTSSETGMDYFLRDNDNDTIVDGPIAGTGSAISLNTGTFSQTMTYNVLARSQKELDTAALELSGSNNSVIIDNNSSFDFNTGTIEMWVNPGTVQFGNEGIFSMRTAFATTRISIHLNANLSTVGIYNTEDGWNPVTVSGLSNNNWTHLAFVIKASGSDLYINGVFNTTINADMDRSKNLLPVVFGSINDGPSEFFHGKIDEVRIWNVERTAIEISDNYLKANVNTTTGLIASYDFYEATDTIVHDAGPNGFEGALVNMNANNWVSGVNNEEACEQVMTQTVSVNVNVIDTAVTSTSTTLTAAETGATYQWLDCNNNMSVISNETNQSFTATVNGSYAVAITNNGCTDTSACKTIASIGINENGLQETFVLYPNPTAGIFTIKTGNEISNAKITIYTVDGKVLLNQMINTKVTVIDLKNFNSGIYFVEIQNGETISTKRIIKQ